jgi:carbamoyl-phosphate synthase large subunit
LRKDPIINPYLVGVDVSGKAVGRMFVDAFYTVPSGDEHGYVQAIVAIVERERIDLVLPGSDQEAFRLANEREKITQAGAVVLASPAPVLELIRDKWATYRTLEKNGLRVPEYACAKNVGELSAAVREHGYPNRSVIVKPINGRGGRGMRVLVGKEDVPPAWVGAGAREHRYENQPAQEEIGSWMTDVLMVMPLLQAPAYDVDVLAVRGRALAAIVRRRNNPAGIPFTGNLIVSDSSVVAYCREIAECLGLDALHDMDLMTDTQGRPCLLEVNPRPSGSVVASHAAGFPVVAAAIASKLGLDYPLSAPVRNLDIAVVPRAIAVGENY